MPISVSERSNKLFMTPVRTFAMARLKQVASSLVYFGSKSAHLCYCLVKTLLDPGLCTDYWILLYTTIWLHFTDFEYSFLDLDTKPTCTFLVSNFSSN